MTDINIGAISEALNNKVDLPSPTVPQDAVDYVVEKQDPTSANGYTWYRKYKSGWVEQGGIVNATRYNVTTMNVSFPVTMANTNYYANANANTVDHQGTWTINARCAVKTTTGMSVHGGNNNTSAYTGPCSWEVKGIAA